MTGRPQSSSSRLDRLRAATRALGRGLRRLFGDTGGNVALIGALIALPLIGGVGVAIDYSRATSAHQRVQQALDAAVLAGAADGSSTWTTLAAKTFDASLESEVTVGSRTFALDADGYYTGTFVGTLATTFTGVISRKVFSIQATATAVRKSGDKVCILLLNTTASPGLLLNGGATLDASTCEVHVKSTGNPAATFNAGTTFTTKKTCVAGSTVLDNGGSHASLTKSCTTVADPFAGTLPTPASSTCTYSNVNVNGGSYTASPGVYCGWINLNNSVAVTFQPGVYVIKGGGINMNGGSWTGTGVTFYFADTSYIQYNGTVKLDLTAPTTGTYAGVLMYEAAGLGKSSFAINATNGADLEGLIYLPSRQVTLNSGASVYSNKLTMVLDTLIMNTVNWKITPGDKSISSTSGGSGVYLKK